MPPFSEPTPSKYPQQFRSSPQWEWYRQQVPWMNAYSDWRSGSSVGKWLSDPGATLAVALQELGGPSAYMGYSTLADIIANQGKTDPTLMNLQKQGIARGGAGTQTALDQMLSQRGWENSGVGAALKQAAMGSTEQKQSQLMAQEAQTAEARKRQDLELLMRMFVEPSLEGARISTGQAGMQAQQSANQSAQQQQALLALAAMFM